MTSAEGCNRDRDQRGAAGRERSEPDLSATQLADRLELLLGVGEPGEDHLRVTDERAAGVGQANPTGRAIDELGSGVTLERGDLLRDRGLAVAQRSGRGRERPLLGDLLEHAQLLHIQHKLSLSLAASNRYLHL